jgi:hypothetical protein
MDQPSPQQQVAGMIHGHWISQAVSVAAKLRLPDLVKDGPRTTEDLARAAACHAPSLYRLLRALTSVGVFAEDERGRFGLTPLADCLRSDAPGSQWAMAVMAGEEHYRAWGELLYSVQTGRTGFEKVYGAPIFDYLAAHPEQAQLFDQGMVGVHGRETGAMLRAVDFTGISVLADLGGGNGSVLIAVLQKYPALRSILFDLPGVAERAKANVRAAGLADRCQVVGGSFFEAVPTGADAYLMRHIIHDWDDERSAQIVRNIHRAMSDRGRLLVVEIVIPPGNEPSFGKLLDLTMLVVPGGRERTRQEYAELFTAGGFRLTRVVPTDAEVSVIEGERIS